MLSTIDQSAVLEEIVARQQITDLLHRYAKGIDRLDWALVRQCFFDDAKIDYGLFKADSLDGFVALGNSLMEHNDPGAVRYETSSHVLFNITIEFADSDTAHVETSMMSIGRKWADGELLNALLVGRYLHLIERRNGEWRIAAYKWILDQEIETKHALIDKTWSSSAVFRGKTDGTDLSYIFLNRKRHDGR